MTELKSIAISDIFVPEDRLRSVKPDFAALYATMLQSGRELAPIKVRRTPNGKAKFTLIAGAHRLEAHRQAGIAEIPAQVVKADREQAREEEIEENLFRNDLSAMERIDAVAEYRRLFEEKFGKIKPQGGDRRSEEFQKGQDGTFEIDSDDLNLLGVHDDSEQGHFYARVTARLGLSARHAKRICAIAQRLHPQLRLAIFGSSVEDNQAAIEALSKRASDDQAKLALLIRDHTKGDVAAAVALLENRPAPDREKTLLSRIESTWSRSSAEVKRAWVLAARDEIEAILADLNRGDGQ